MNYFVLVMSAIQTVLGVYLGWRCRWAFGGVLPPWLMAWYAFWPIVALIVMSFPLVHFFSRRWGVELPPWLLLATAVLYGALVMAFVTVLIADVLGLVACRLSFLQPVCTSARLHPHYLGYLILGIVAAQVAFGFYRAQMPRETYFSPVIHKPLKNGAKRLRIVQVSDLHVSRYSSVTLMREITARVNRLQPDIIVFTGDIIDSSVKPYFDQKLPSILGGLKSRYGVYAVLGNHDYFSGSSQYNIDAYSRSNMRVLRDEVLYLEDPGLTLIGRDDWSRGTRQPSSGGSPGMASGRAPIADLVKRADSKLPLILLDHQPREIDGAIAQKIDLQFSGHTHDGQFFPFQFIVDSLYKEVWGMLTQGTYTLIVSCGFGTWGPPLRFPSYAEIVVADVFFQSPSSPP